MTATQARLLRAVLLFGIGAVGAAAATSPAGTVSAWGINSNSQTNVPQALIEVASVAGGEFHSLALKTDGGLVSWGSTVATNVPPSLTNAVSIACGRWHSLALRADGTVTVWGNNNNGQTNVPAGLKEVMAIAGGGLHSLALRSNGTVVAWGASGAPQSTVPAGLSGVTAIAAGYFHSLALKDDSTVVVWGKNTAGATNLPAGLTNVIAIAAGYGHSLALTREGRVVAWGDNTSGQTNVPAELTNVIAIAAGYSHSLALKGDGTIAGWGDDTWAQRSIPAGVGHTVKIACGYYHSLALTLAPVLLSSLPTATTLRPGNDTMLSVSAWSTAPLAYQWFFNDARLPDATSTNLHLVQFGPTQAGVYRVSISNQYGGLTAAGVVRLTNSPVVLVDGADIGGGVIERVDSTRVTMTSTFGASAAMYYTTDGTTPDFTAAPYTGATVFKDTVILRAIAYNATYTESAEAAPITILLRPTYRLTVAVPGGGRVTAAPDPYAADNRYLSNTLVTLSAEAIEGWTFVKWTGDHDATTAVTSLLMDRPRTLAAVFGASLQLITNGPGRILANPTNDLYAYGSSVQLTASPLANAYFFGWAGAASGYENPLNLTVTNPVGVTALFGVLRSNQVLLTVLSATNGTITANPSQRVYTNGQSVTLTATPASGYVFKQWSGAPGGATNPLALTLLGNTVVQADFVPWVPTNPPVITQPLKGGILRPGANTVLSVTVSGDGPFTYLWRLNGVNLASAVGSQLALNGLTSDSVGRYDVIVTGAAGVVTNEAVTVALFDLELVPSEDDRAPLLMLDAPPAAQYRLEWTDNPAMTNWTLLWPVTMAERRFYYTDAPVASHSRRFYRVIPGP